MKSTNPNHQTETIHGLIERVTFHSEETGFCVLKINAPNQRDLVTVIGSAASVTPGEEVDCSGNWVNSPEHGVQFKAETIQTRPPNSLEGIQKYLGSGMLRGIGPHFAKVLIKKFGEAIFDIFDAEPKRLREVDGIGDKRLEMIITSWQEQKAIRNIMIFLQSYGVGTARAVRIYSTYGDKAIEIVRENPYRLALDIIGIGFKTADAIAMKIGVAKDSLQRAQAGIRHVIQEYAGLGHCAISRSKLITTAVELLEIPEKTIIEAITAELTAKNIILDKIAEEDFLFLTALYQAEALSAKHLARIKQGTLPWEISDLEKALQWAEKQAQITLSPSQRHAVNCSLKEKITVITGGPGVGKTTIINCIIKIVRAKGTKVLLAAPTGRAAKRLSEATKLQAKTIHRLLEYDPRRRTFKHNQNNPLAADLVIIDEASMVDIVLWYSLIKSIPDNASLIIVGDIDQLPSVGPGNVLADIINSQTIPVVRLREIFRQAAASQIIVNAHRINEGQFYPKKDAIQPDNSDFYFIAADTPEDIQSRLITVVTQRIPQRFGFHPIYDIQVLTPMNRGGLGTASLNLILQEKLNSKSEPRISRFGTTFRSGDKVIQNINNYDKEVFNGDVGFIAHINLEDGEVNINFDQRLVKYSFNDLDQISLAYATSIHKSQGSEYPVVVIPISIQHYMLLARNLVYTAVTRGKKLVVMIGQTKAIAIAVKNVSQQPRITNLRAQLVKELT